MVARRKPTGQEYVEWCITWDTSDHKGKMENCCAPFKIKYDTGKSWRSSADLEVDVPIADFGLIGDKFTEAYDEPTLFANADDEELCQSIEDILPRQAQVELDFVCFDIETTNLTADFSVLLCACIKPWGRPIQVFRADDYNSRWSEKRNDDSAIVKAIATELSRHAIVVTHYGVGFDIPYLRAKMVKHGLPPLPQMFGVDTYSIAKRNFRVSSRRLENLCRYFELGQKSSVQGGLWMEASMNGSKEALDEIVEHNKKDVVLLERLASLCFPYLKSIRRA